MHGPCCSQGCFKASNSGAGSVCVCPREMLLAPSSGVASGARGLVTLLGVARCQPLSPACCYRPLIPGWARSATNAQLTLGAPREIPDMIQPPLHVLGQELMAPEGGGCSNTLNCVSSPLPGVWGSLALPGSGDLLVPRLLVRARMNSETAQHGCTGPEGLFRAGFSSRV